MFNSLAKSIALFAFVIVGAAGTTTATTGTAAAGNLQYGIVVGGTNLGIRVGSHRYRRHYRRHHSHYRRGRCTARHALRKARRIGVHRGRVVRANRRRVVVRGRRHRHHVRVVFANRHSCPIIRYRR